MTGAPRDPWSRLRAITPARIALGRAGASLPTQEVLEFALAHARARDAVHAELDPEAIAGRFNVLGVETVLVESDATDRALYLRRPDLGRRLSATSRLRLEDAARYERPTFALVIADGLSAVAVEANAVALTEAFLRHCQRREWTVGPVVIARGARVALGDEIGEALRARLVAVLIGERPGLSAADSLGVYLTSEPKTGRTDAERNCISNIRAGGLEPQMAAAKLAWLAGAALDCGVTGIGLKDESDAASMIGSDDCTAIAEDDD